MKVKFLVIGKTTDSKLQALVDVYAARLKHYIAFETIVIPELKQTAKLSFEQQKQREAALLLARIAPTDDVLLLDEGGRQFSSVDFARFMEQKMVYSNKTTIFVVGGPYGFSNEVYERANGKISLSAMTFSHQMIRLIFTEQLYRAMTIIKGEPYHHE